MSISKCWDNTKYLWHEFVHAFQFTLICIFIIIIYCSFSTSLFSHNLDTKMDEYSHFRACNQVDDSKSIISMWIQFGSICNEYGFIGCVVFFYFFFFTSWQLRIHVDWETRNNNHNNNNKKFFECQSTFDSMSKFNALDSFELEQCLAIVFNDC